MRGMISLIFGVGGILGALCCVAIIIGATGLTDQSAFIGVCIVMVGVFVVAVGWHDLGISSEVQRKIRGVPPKNSPNHIKLSPIWRGVPQKLKDDSDAIFGSRIQEMAVDPTFLQKICQGGTSKTLTELSGENETPQKSKRINPPN
jgi:hypothetical protein